jgi:transcriptional regulator with XRE-family HTH domain
VYIVNLRLKEIRKSKGYSTRELEKRSDVSRMRIEELEKEENVNIKTSTLCKLAEALDVRPEELIYFTYEEDTDATT